MMHICNPSYSGDRRIKSSRPGQAEFKRPYLKNKIQNKKAGGMAQSPVLKEKKKGK
jgi:hypothetical protein